MTYIIRTKDVLGRCFLHTRHPREPVLSPRDAMYAEEETIDFCRSAGRISKEFIIPYPPGIPMVVPGEMLTKEIIDGVEEMVSQGGQIIGPHDPSLKDIVVVAEK